MAVRAEEEKTITLKFTEKDIDKLLGFSGVQQVLMDHNDRFRQDCIDVWMRLVDKEANKMPRLTYYPT